MDITLTNRNIKNLTMLPDCAFKFNNITLL